MDDPPQKNILARPATISFDDQTVEVEMLWQHAQALTRHPGLLLLSARQASASELLRQFYDRLFYEQGEIVPFYFSINRQDKTAKDCARRFLQNFLLQVVAFRRNDPHLLDASPEAYEIGELSAASDALWVDRLLAAYERESRRHDERAFVRNCLSAPLRAAAHGVRVFVMIDDFHNAENLAGETNFVEELKEIYSRSTVQFVLAGRRRYVLKAAQTGSNALNGTEILRLAPLSDSNAGALIESLAEKYAVEINEQTRDLIVRQFDSYPLFIESLFTAAAERKTNLDCFQAVQQIYVDELFGGRIGKFYDAQFYEVAADFKVQARTIRLLHNLLTGESKKIKAEAWRKHFNSSEEFYRVLQELHTREIINWNSQAIEISDEDLCLKDYLDARYRLEILNEQRALVVGNFLVKFLKRASQIMARFYRCSSAIGWRELMAAFNCQIVPASLLDYEKFKEIHKGAAEEEILENLKAEDEQINLPQVVHAATAAAFYPAVGEVSDEERSAVAIGFESGDYREENEIAWIAAEIDSKLEASRKLTESWCDRLETLALMCNFSKYQLWLVTPEGFTPEAAQILKERNVFASSREQVRLLAQLLKVKNAVQKRHDANEYEMIVPMGDDTEMIAAHAVEEIARRHDFQPKAITQIKTALVEACINATEHSLSPDRKIYQKFTVEDNKIIITISNRGVKIPPKKVAEMTTQIEPDEGRRGWGLKLMRTLMDEVKFEQVDDGTRISMVKYLK